MRPFDPRKPYNALPPLPPETNVETTSVLKACIGAHRYLATLKEAGNRLPNQGILVNSVSILEARAGSEIENIVTTTDALFEAQLREGRMTPDTKEALCYADALSAGMQIARNRPSPLTRYAGCVQGSADRK
ncbi:MAG: hypothetical protein OXF02_00400 [Simkaniaceae bacterium]|nr:hypothetical protein [Simkaniaceae bacterium]